MKCETIKLGQIKVLPKRKEAILNGNERDNGSEKFRCSR